MVLISSQAFAINKCDELAADPLNKDNPKGVIGVEWENLQAEPAIKACLQAITDEPNNARYQYQLSRAYDKHDDETNGLKWLKKSAEQGYGYAEYKLGNKYKIGDGVTANYQTALAWYTKSVEHGYPNAARDLGDNYLGTLEEGGWDEESYKLALMWLTKAAKLGDANGQYLLGYLYSSEYTEKPDFKMTVKWYTKAAKQGNIRAQYDLGNCYYYGNGVKIDKNQAVKLWIEAAKQGNTDAQQALKSLGITY